MQKDTRRTSLSRSCSVRMSSDSSDHDELLRITSMGEVSQMGSQPRGSISISHDGSSVVFEGTPAEMEVLTGNSGGRLTGSGSRENSTGRTSSRGSWRRSSFNLSQRSSGRVLDSISLSFNLSQRSSGRVLDSISLSQNIAQAILGDVDSSVIAQVGDSGDRVVGNDKELDDDDLRDFMHNAASPANGVSTLPHDVPILSNGSLSRVMDSSLSPVSPIHEVMSPLPTDAILHLPEKNKMQVRQSSSSKERLPRNLDYISYMIHLAVFGQLGVFTRYSLQKLFGPGHLALTGDQTPLYLDLPSNILGSFLMGWFGVVLKADISHLLSDHIAVGITTGYLGSLTTFSGWNQKMLDLSSKGHWVFAVAGIILGMLIVNESIRIGVESAEAFRRRLLKRFIQVPGSDRCCLGLQRVDRPKKQLTITTIALLILISLWVSSGILAVIKLDNLTNDAVLWLGCLVGPPGVWIRWYLARLNGQGIGRKQLLKWLPIGTLSANVLAACLMAALATTSKAVNTKRCRIIVSGVQFGLLGCLSTVSTFVAEVYTMRQTGHSGRALAYAAATILFSFAMGILIYSVPVWTEHYE